MEALGGGGNAGAAGAQIPGKTLEQVLSELHEALDRYFDGEEGSAEKRAARELGPEREQKPKEG